MVAGGIVILLVFVAMVLLLFVDIGTYKSRLEAATSGAMGMDVRVGGRLGIDLFPNVYITLEDVHIGNQDDDVASVKEARIGIDLLPLLRREVRILTITLKHSIISIERDLDGNFNFEKPEAADGRLSALGLSKDDLSEGTLLLRTNNPGRDSKPWTAALKSTICDFRMVRVRIS